MGSKTPVRSGVLGWTAVTAARLSTSASSAVHRVAAIKGAQAPSGPPSAC